MSASHLLLFVNMAEIGERQFRRVRKWRLEACLELAAPLEADALAVSCAPDAKRQRVCESSVPRTTLTVDVSAPVPSPSFAYGNDRWAQRSDNEESACVSVQSSRGDRESGHGRGDGRLEQMCASADVTNDEAPHDVAAVDFRRNLQLWALESKSSHKAVTSLLGVLRKRKCLASLPSTARTLLKTPKSTHVLTMAGGKFHHFGLEAGLRQALQSCKELPTELVINVNVDDMHW